MGIDRAAASFLGYAHATGVDLSTTLTIGRQSRFGSSAALADALASFVATIDREELVADLDRDRPWADAVFHALGAETLAALDVSDFEGATILHDLNQPLADDRAGQWSCVVDGGASEHVFNLPVALETTMRLVAPGGHLITSVPANQQVGHGFYQVGPELYFRALVPANGFELEAVLLHEAGLVDRWTRMQDPAEAGHRLTIGTLGPADLFVCARRIGDAALRVVPQQSDYAAAWTGASAPATPTGSAPSTRRSRRSWREELHRRAGPRLGPALQAARHVVRSGRGAGIEHLDLVAEARRRAAPGYTVLGG